MAWHKAVGKLLSVLDATSTVISPFSSSPRMRAAWLSDKFMVEVERGEIL
jgi:hypothetical protein